MSLIYEPINRGKSHYKEINMVGMKWKEYKQIKDPKSEGGWTNGIFWFLVILVIVMPLIPLFVGGFAWMNSNKPVKTYQASNVFIGSCFVIGIGVLKVLT
jgi:hypothetical protein